jgi:hypothetical protein
VVLYILLGEPIAVDRAFLAVKHAGHLLTDADVTLELPVDEHLPQPVDEPFFCWIDQLHSLPGNILLKA